MRNAAQWRQDIARERKRKVRVLQFEERKARTLVGFPGEKKARVRLSV
jgi:hypothetical protein